MTINSRSKSAEEEDRQKTTCDQMKPGSEILEDEESNTLDMANTLVVMENSITDN